MVQKRPFDAEEMLEVSFKHPKQAGPSNQLISFSESVFPGNSSQIPETSESGCRQVNTDGDEKLASDIFVEHPRDAGDVETSFPGSNFVSSWAPSTSEDVRSDMPVHFSFYPEYFSSEHPVRTLTRHEDIYSILLEHPPRKLVPIGADHQADVPTWDLPGSTSVLDTSSNSSPAVGGKSGERWMGTCIIPMSNMELSTDDGKVGRGRTDCSCEDWGSVRCVRQHIAEAREELAKTTELERFNDLGLCDMGEQVAEKWNAEDEQLFHEVVFSNPASLSKNFWNTFPIVFPARTKKEIVSYYFNVFMLRRRAEQNRNDHLNIDSDNDEWQGSDANEIATLGEDEDSVAESPVYQDDTDHNNCHENDLQDYDEYPQDETCDTNEVVDFTKSDIDDDLKYDPEEMQPSSSSPQHIQCQDKIICQERCDDEALDESYTSSDPGVSSQEIKGKTENDDLCSNDLNGVNNGFNTGYATESCDAKAWDSGFMSCAKDKIDFLPTCSMIEEVFGDGLRQEMRRA
ncbi:uncharacterized protein LOC129308528 [Prosopis cineraria]|uniref:uncharacterized protein LOC129308528 n=1 Tax=Prosopis cineraria TaxID=364024 RepID=UPI00240FD8F5|nr:uncharacterized protein LOC129308528 [Prosopis cineraria]XP_054805663.1 uncharacterized protein LOC129308528 [Prosopis cineraria]